MFLNSVSRVAIHAQALYQISLYSTATKHCITTSTFRFYEEVLEVPLTNECTNSRKCVLLAFISMK